MTVPASGRFGGVYVQAISTYAPHPNAAKLWMEYLYSDEGQLIWLKGYCHPIRYDDLVARGVVPADQLAKLPDIDRRGLPDARAARGRDRPDHHGVGHGRRRRRRRARRSDLSTGQPPGSCGHDASSGARLRRVPLDAFRWAWLGLVPFFLFAFLFIFCPGHVLVIGSFQNDEGQTTLENYVGLSAPGRSRSFLLQHRDQPRDGDRRRALRLPARLRRHPRRPAPAVPRALMTFSRRRLELRGRPARPGLHLHARPAPAS